jgi:hypothetical protein
MRLPKGGYAWRGRVVSFSKLPKGEKHRFRSAWSRKAAATVRREIKSMARIPPRRAGIHTFFREAGGEDGDSDRGYAGFPAVVAVNWVPLVEQGRATLEDVTSAIEARARREGSKAGAFYAKLFWKDETEDDRYSFVSLAKGDVGAALAEQMALFLGEVEEDPDTLDRSKSGRTGKAIVVEVGLILTDL